MKNLQNKISEKLLKIRVAQSPSQRSCQEKRVLKRAFRIASRKELITKITQKRVLGVRSLTSHREKSIATSALRQVRHKVRVV